MADQKVGEGNEMKLTFEETMRKLLATYHDDHHHRRGDEYVDDDIEDIATWLIKKWGEDTGEERTLTDDDNLERP